MAITSQSYDFTSSTAKDLFKRVLHSIKDNTDREALKEYSTMFKDSEERVGFLILEKLPRVGLLVWSNR